MPPLTESIPIAVAPLQAAMSHLRSPSILTRRRILGSLALPAVAACLSPRLIAHAPSMGSVEPNQTAALTEQLFALGIGLAVLTALSLLAHSMRRLIAQQDAATQTLKAQLELLQEQFAELQQSVDAPFSDLMPESSNNDHLAPRWLDDDQGNSTEELHLWVELEEDEDVGPADSEGPSDPRRWQWPGERESG